MEIVNQLIEIILHVDVFIDQQVGVWGVWMYLLLFLIIFCETGLVVTPFLPGDSLLFAAGAVAAREGNPLDITVLLVSLTIAAIVGDSVNYSIGHKMGPAVLKNPDSRVFRKDYLDRTQHFFEKHGAKTIILARFVPIVRTFAPFLAGVGAMRYGRFITFNVVGGIVWVALFLLAGYFFGSITVVEENMTLVLVAVVLVTTAPVIWEYLRHKFQRTDETPADSAAD